WANAAQCDSLLTAIVLPRFRRRDGRVAEGARLESVFTRKGNVGSNPTLSASSSNRSQTCGFRACYYSCPVPLTKNSEISLCRGIGCEGTSWHTATLYTRITTSAGSQE